MPGVCLLSIFPLPLERKNNAQCVKCYLVVKEKKLPKNTALLRVGKTWEDLGMGLYVDSEMRKEPDGVIACTVKSISQNRH